MDRAHRLGQTKDVSSATCLYVYLYVFIRVLSIFSCCFRIRPSASLPADADTWISLVFLWVSCWVILMKDSGDLKSYDAGFTVLEPLVSIAPSIRRSPDNFSSLLSHQDYLILNL